jgi:hypothetical protein
MKVPIPRSGELLEHLQEALTPNRLPLLIAVDGADGIGKSSLASWLAWQLGMPAVQLDLYLITGRQPIQWMTEDLERVVAHRLARKQPLIIDGVLALDAIFLHLGGNTAFYVAGDKDDKVCLTFNLVERVQCQNAIKYQGLFPCEPVSTNAFQILRHPLNRLPTGDEI